MTALPPPADPTNQQGQNLAQSQTLAGPTAQPAPTQQTTQPLPPTGIQQQLASLNQTYDRVGQAEYGFDVAEFQFGQGQEALPGVPQQQAQAPVGTTNLNNLAQNLAKSYGLEIGRGDLVDQQGNLQVSPDQIAAASGGQETMGTAAAKLNMIADAIQRQQQDQQMKKSEAALQAGVGLVQSRGRGSLAALQSGFYQSMSNLYQNQQYEAADFSYFIEKEKMDIQQEMMRRAEDAQKKKARFGAIGGVITGVLGVATGNPFLAAQGFSTAAGNAGGTGWF